ncbi:unnamed protein product [Clonostachys rhizophaga]|uniref:Chorismate-utilising enzyme C-terminal domain-containing protein n=1 Tax=Clonostachys rhizophaga TaxID=160324 RepID=A0A9N9VLT8_9HYPO|nr:unnamed protein product [Clonostachys rhizophaga]
MTLFNMHPDSVGSKPFTLHFDPKRTLEATAKILRSSSDDHYAYERDGVWFAGIGHKASLTLAPDGKTTTVSTGTNTVTTDTGPDFTDTVTTFIQQHHAADQKVFGFVGFNYSAYIRGMKFAPGKWPLVNLFVPRIFLEVSGGTLQIWNGNNDDIASMKLQLDELNVETLSESKFTPAHIALNQDHDEYFHTVQQALSSITSGKYEKVIASRQVRILGQVDMIKTLIRGLQMNTPKRTFILRQGGFEATGFSPELVMSVVNNHVTTEPLAGTRSNVGTDEERQKLKAELIRDPKEIVEHVVSVKEAIQEMNHCCRPDSVSVHDFMTIKNRGRVQHIGSSVQGQLDPLKKAWDAFNTLFPSVTASGIPKTSALKAIANLEPRPRELYSGAVLLIDNSEVLEAALVLRSVFQDRNGQWVQAGAGIVEMSKEEREYTETCEKLQSFAPFIVLKSSDK